MTFRSRRQFLRTFTLATGGLVLASTSWAQALDPDDLPNLFISPCGQPFRAARGAPYPVMDWFKAADKNADGKLDHGEFMADSEAFFKVLDLRGGGYLDDFDIAVYEHNLVPEILGARYGLNQYGPPARIWLAQGMGSGMTMGDGVGPIEGDSDPKPPKDIDESHVGAAPFSFFKSPEPVTAADTQFRGRVTKADFMALAERRFTALDSGALGYLALATLPKTEAQVVLEKVRRKRS